MKTRSHCIQDRCCTIHKHRIPCVVLALSALLFLLAFQKLEASAFIAQESNSGALGELEAVETSTDEKGDASATAEIDDAPNVAAQFSELKESIEDSKKQLAKLEAELDDPESEYHRAEREFLAFSKDLEQTNESLEAARKLGETEAVEKLEREVASLERLRKLAQDRFDLEIESRKTVRDQIRTLKSKIQKDLDALNALTGDKPEQEGLPTDRDNESRSTSEASDHSKDETKTATDDEKTSDDKHLSTDESSQEEKSEELLHAEDEAKQKGVEARQAEEQSKSLEARIEDLQRLVNQEQKEWNLARKKTTLAVAEQNSLADEIAKRQAENADPAELLSLRQALNNANQRAIKARIVVEEISERLNDHRADLATLQTEHIVVLNEAKFKQHEAKAAEDRVESLRNPYTPRNIMQWLLDHGVRLCCIVIGMILLNRIAYFFAHRSVRFVSAGTGRGNTVERENRARTLVGVFQNAATVAIFISGTLMILEEVGANITVLMGGVAVIGLAVAFGAQNLIKDYFYGFVMLLENQYMLNDSIQIGAVSGQVERITLRMTVLRDSNGVVHFIPNGTINSVSNETHGWSRAVCEVSVGYDEDIDRVTDLLNDVAQEFKSDSAFGKLMLDAPTRPSIDCLAESSIRIKTAVKTLPNKHGMVKQEWLRRIHQRFQSAGIRPAYPRRTMELSQDSKVFTGDYEASKRAA